VKGGEREGRLTHQDTVEDPLDGLGNVLSRVLGLSNRGGKDLGPKVGESGLDKNVPKRKEATPSAWDD
jgi:hypothetical protein